MDLEIRNVKTIYRKTWSVNLLQVLNLTLHPCFYVNWGHHTKTPDISLIIGLRAWKCETTYIMPWPANPLQVSDLIFDPCFNDDLQHHTKNVLYLLENVTFEVFLHILAFHVQKLKNLCRPVKFGM